MSEDSFLREVEDELRSEKLKAFWRRFAPFVIGAAVLIVVAVAGNEAWNWWRSSRAAAASERFYAANELAETGDSATAIAAFDAIIADGPAGYATLARFRQAGLYAQAGDTDAALALYDALGTSAPEQRLRELALVMGAYLLVDTGDVAAVQTRVSGVIDIDSPLRLSAREALGLVQYRAGDLDDARANFETLAAESGSNQDLQSRALVYLEVLAAEGGDGAEAGEALPGEPGVDELGVDELGPQAPTDAPLSQEPAADAPVDEAPAAAAEPAAAEDAPPEDAPADEADVSPAP